MDSLFLVWSCSPETEDASLLVGCRSYIGAKTLVSVASKITIGNDVMISWGCIISDHDSHSIYPLLDQMMLSWRSDLFSAVLARLAWLSWTHVRTAEIFMPTSVGWVLTV